jgi:Flp pilus assembly protein TadG
MVDSVVAAVQLMIIAYPLLFLVMAVFAGLTYLLNKAFPGE